MSSTSVIRCLLVASLALVVSAGIASPPSQPTDIASGKQFSRLHKSHVFTCNLKDHQIRRSELQLGCLTFGQPLPASDGSGNDFGDESQRMASSRPFLSLLSSATSCTHLNFSTCDLQLLI